MAFPFMKEQILLDALAARVFTSYLVAHQHCSLPYHTCPDRANRRLLGEVALGYPTTLG